MVKTKPSVKPCDGYVPSTGRPKKVIMSSMALFLLFQKYTESKGSFPDYETGNSTVTTTVTTTTDPTSIVVAVGTGTIVTVALVFVFLFCCRLRSIRATMTTAEASPEDRRRRMSQGVSTAYSSTPTVVSLHQYADSLLPQQQQQQVDLDAESFNDPIYGNVSSPVLQDRWNWGQRLSRAVRRLLPLTATDSGVKDQWEVSARISVQDEVDVDSDSLEDAVYVNCPDVIHSSYIK